MARRAILSWFCAVASVAMMASACTPPPEEAARAAEDAINQAREGEAEKYAKAMFDEAVAQLETAKAHMAAEEYAEAKTAFEKTIEMAGKVGQEVSVQRELMKAETEQALEAFMSRWKEVSDMIEKGKGKDAKALAGEAAAYAATLTEKLNMLKENNQWYDLKMALEEANMKADEFSSKVSGN